VGVVRLDITAPFDFARPLGDSAELVCFRDNRAPAILDLHHPNHPSLISINGLRHVDSTESLGNAGFLVVNGGVKKIQPVAADYQVLDASKPGSPLVLATVSGVQQRIRIQLNGAVYLLGAEGLTIIRRPKVEEEYNTEVTTVN
jgi:hypothetical protein